MLEIYPLVINLLPKSFNPKCLKAPKRPPDLFNHMVSWHWQRKIYPEFHWTKMSCQRARSHWVPSDQMKLPIRKPSFPLLTATDFPTSKSSLSFGIGLSILFSFDSWSNFSREKKTLLNICDGLILCLFCNSSTKAVDRTWILEISN